MDAFQKKYLKHQEYKKKLLAGEIKESSLEKYTEAEIQAFFKIFKNRKSHRVFSEGIISQDKIDILFNTLYNTPSSCNRKGVKTKAIRIQYEKDLIEKTLKGGRGWINKAKIIVLLFADMTAYKSPNEKDFMPYLDAGFLGMSVYLICESLGLKCCFVNPNMDKNKKEFYEEFVKTRDKGNWLLVGAVAIGL